MIFQFSLILRPLYIQYLITSTHMLLNINRYAIISYTVTSPVMDLPQ